MMRSAPLLIAVLLLAAGLLPFTAADNDSLKVVVLVEDKEYSVGSAGKVTVHVFDKGVHVDADAPPTVALAAPTFRSINVTKTSTGVYEGSFTLQAGDLYNGYAAITATATLGKSGPSDATYNEDTATALLITQAAAGPGLAVDCMVKSIGGGALKAGAAVALEARVTYNGTPAAPSRFQLTSGYYDPSYNAHTSTLNSTNSSTGVYDAVLTVPDLSYNTDLRFTASASYQGTSSSGSCSLTLDFFNVIYHFISRSSNSTVFDLYVADAGGKPVSGANISMSVRPDDNGSAEHRVGPGITGARGALRITLDVPEGTKVLNIQGTVDASGKTQSFSGSITIQGSAAAPPTPSGDSFQAVLNGTEQLYKAGSTVERDYVLFNNSAPWAGKDVYCYIVFNTYSLSESRYSPVSVEARNLTTDASGRLHLSVHTPSGKDSYVEVFFESATGVHPKPNGYYYTHDSLDGLYYAEASDEFMASRTAPGDIVKVEVGKLALGAQTKVEASARSGDHPLAYAAWGVGQVSSIYDASGRDKDWSVWSQVPGILTKSGSRYSGTVSIPSFMPKDKTYTVIVMLDSDTMVSEYGTASLKPGEGTAQAAFPWMYLVIAAVIIAVAAGVAVVVAKRRKTPAHPPSEVVNFAGAPAPVEPHVPSGQAPPGETQGPLPPGVPAGLRPAPVPSQQASPAQYQQAPTAPFQQPTAAPYQQAPPGQYQPQPAPQYPPQTQPQQQYPAPPGQPPRPYPAQPQQYSQPVQPYQQQYPQQYPQQSPQQYPQQHAAGAPPPQFYQPPAAAPSYAPVPTAVPPPSPIPPPPPSRQGRMTMPNNAICGFCNQWILQGQTGILCQCGKYYHEHCAKIQETCPSCGAKLGL